MKIVDKNCTLLQSQYQYAKFREVISFEWKSDINTIHEFYFNGWHTQKHKFLYVLDVYVSDSKSLRVLLHQLAPLETFQDAVE